MRTIEYTSQFKRDFKRRVRKGPHRRALEVDFARIINALAMD
jgi:mRNA-degrading endonuclease YafQ of YafQ-DinJ toxin-antitoxin module